ncbi:MAG TPA: cytochrome P450 [Bryobacteraceae bacterium]|nr:cytochrome P450 [Bryobacteraceae bacterium]
MNMLTPAFERPPGPKPTRSFFGVRRPARFGFGVLGPFRKDPPGFLLGAAREFGDLVYLPLARQHGYLVNRPDWIRDILVTHQSNFVKSRILERAKVLLGEGLLTSEDEFHTRQRRLVQPAFHRDRLAHYAAEMVACAARLRDRWQPGDQLDLVPEMTRLTLAIVGRTLFSADVSSDADGIGHAMTVIFSLFDTLLMPFADWIQKLPLPPVRRFERARASLDKVIYGLIAERRASGHDAGDLLSMLLLAVDEDRSAMTDRQVRDEALTLLIAGHETTANALIWSWYLLSQNPEAEVRLHAELEQVLGGRLPVFDDVPKLRYTTGVLSEALRLYPPAWAIGRRAKQDYRIGEYRIPAGSILLMSPWVSHRDPRWFPEPEKFDPDRWRPEIAEKLPKFAYFPFGGGARVCIGERFAWTEGVLVLATLAQRWKLRLVPGQVVDTRAVITLRPRNGIRMVVERAP